MLHGCREREAGPLLAVKNRKEAVFVGKTPAAQRPRITVPSTLKKERPTLTHQGRNVCFWCRAGRLFRARDPRDD